MDQVIFNGPSKIIECLPHVNVLDVLDLYKEWKRWIIISDNSKYLAAFNVVGGDQTIEDEIIEPYFFLTNGWVIKPKEEDHMLIVQGLLFTSNGSNPIVSTDGDHVVTVYLKTPAFTASTINYGEIQRAAVDDILEQFMQQYMLFNTEQKQSIRDALLLNPSDSLDSELYSIDTRLERIDINTQRFGTEFGNNMTINVDTTLLENKMSALSVKIEDVKNIADYNKNLNMNMGNKVDLLVHRSDATDNSLSNIQLSSNDIRNILNGISTKIDAL